MAAYIIAQVEVTDPDGFARYREMVAPTLEQYGGRYIVRGGETETLEGEWEPGRLVVIQFDSVEQAMAWWACEEYAEAKALRQRTAKTTLTVVEGL